MTIAETFLAELDREAGGTIKALERVPKDKLDWRPHAKSRTLGELAQHVAALPSFAALGLREGKREMATAPRPGSAPDPNFAGTFKKAVADFKSSVAAMSDERLQNETFSFTANGQPVRTFSKEVFLRNVVMNHFIHHRGQLTVYLRLLDIPVPAIYGVSADENPFARP
ncbi:MAG TPA: DinB family protein [Thermoanaerobaculia bacterium]|nr:DinB family protein [Thermoanaerobaculia bacterium]